MSRFARGLLLSMVFACFAACRLAAEPMPLVVGGQPRIVQLERPARAGPHPTIIMLHGAGVSVEEEGRATGLAGLGPHHGYVVAFPEGKGRRWNFSPPGKVSAQDVKFFEQLGGVPDDIAFLKAVIGELVKRGVADPKRIYLAGRSLGGVMALRMACVDAKMFAALALLISAMPETNGVDCKFSKSLPVVLVNGTADPVLPYAGGQSRRGDALWPTERLVAFLRTTNGCGESTEKAILPGQHAKRTEIEQSTKCAGGPVSFYRIVGGGHDVPLDLDPGMLLLGFFGDKSHETASDTAVAGPAQTKCRRFETRLFADLCNGCTRPPFNQEIVKTGENDWTVSYVDGTKMQRTYKYRQVAESDSEILMYDQTRDIHARIDLKSRTGFARRGQQGPWVPLLNILSADCL